jgi:hypothetical protein
MAIKFNRSQTFATNGTVTAAGLHNLIDGTDIYQALITDQTNLTSVGSADELLIADADLTAGDAPRAVTVNELFEDALTISTYTNANINNISYGTSTGTRLVATNASITTGTIPNLTSSTASITIGTIPTLTAGTTTSTAANITNGTIQTLTSSTATITGGTFSGLLNSSTGTFSGAINSTAGTIGTLNSTTGTITNLSTTLAGDVTISSGTATVSTRVAVVNTAQEYTATHNFNATNLTITSGTIPWDLSANQVAKLEVTTNSTLNTPTNPVDGATYMLVVTQGTGGSNTLSFSTAYKFPGGSAPVLSTGSADVDVLAFVSNGTVLYGVTSQDFS